MSMDKEKRGKAYQDFLIARYAGKAVMARKRPEQILKIISEELSLQPCTFSELDPFEKDSLRIQAEFQKANGQNGYDPVNWEFYRVEENQASRLFYQYFKSRFRFFPFVYIFKDDRTDKLGSNCELLKTRLFLLQGIDPQDAKEKTSAYFHYLNGWELYETAVQKEREGSPEKH